MPSCYFTQCKDCTERNVTIEHNCHSTCKRHAEELKNNQSYLDNQARLAHEKQMRADDILRLSKRSGKKCKAY